MYSFLAQRGGIGEGDDETPVQEGRFRTWLSTWLVDLAGLRLSVKPT